MNQHPLAPRSSSSNGPSTFSTAAPLSRKETPHPGKCAGSGMPTEMSRPLCSVRRSVILASRWMAESA